MYNGAHWIFVVQYLQTCNALPYMLRDAQVSLELDEFMSSKPGGAQLIQSTCQRFHKQYTQSIKVLKAKMQRGSRKIMIFGGVVLLVMTLKAILLLVFVRKYNYWLFFSIQLDLIIIVSVFIYSLCKIMKIAKKHSIEIYKCYLYMHFVSVIFLFLTWSSDFTFYVLQ